MVSMENSDVPTIVLALFIVTALSILLYYLFWKVGYIYCVCVVIATLVYWIVNSVLCMHILVTEHFAYLSQICIYREPITILNCFVTILMLPCVGLAIHFFFSGITDWRVSFHLLLSIHNTIISFSFFSSSSSPLSFPQLTPSESRALNRPCVVMSYYDSHDVWHFLSAGALFLAFMVSWLLYNACVYVLRTQCMLLSQTLFLSCLVYVDPRWWNKR